MRNLLQLSLVCGSVLSASHAAILLSPGRKI